jgi:hypothetical protein
VNRQLGTVAPSTASGANTSAVGMVALSMAAVSLGDRVGHDGHFWIDAHIV